MRVREKRTIGKGHAADDDNGIDLIEHPSIPVIVLHFDETQGATIDEMHADTDHNTECHGTMDIIVPEGFEGYVGMDAIPQTVTCSRRLGSGYTIQATATTKQQ